MPALTAAPARNAPRSARRRALTFAARGALVLAGVLVSAGCAPGAQAPSVSGANPGDQTTAEACALVRETINDATEGFQTAALEDPESTVAAMQNASNQLADLAPQITNPEVAAIVPEMQAMFTQAADSMQAIVDNDSERLGELNELGADFQQTTVRFQELCGA